MLRGVTATKSATKSARVRALQVLAGGVLVLAGAASLAGSAFAADSGVSVGKPWMRFIIAARPAAGYMTLTNTGSATRVLTGASSPACKSIMLHRSMTKDGSDMMAPVKSVRIAPNKSVSFAPGGYHLMCMSPAMDMASKRTVPVKLTFDDGGSLTADFDVRGAAGQ